MKKSLLSKLIGAGSIFAIVGSTILVIGLTDKKETVNKSDPSNPGTITEVSVDHIEVTTMPTKLAYEEFEMFDPTGMVVTAFYTDNTTKVLETEDYIINLKNPLISTDKFVTITEKSYAKDCNFPITVNSGGEITSDPQLWYEAEYCTFETSNTLDCGSSCKLIEEASGEIVLYRFGIYAGNKLYMKVNSTQGGKTKMVLKVCKRPQAAKFEDMYSVTVNNVKYPVQGEIPSGSGEFELFEFTSYLYLNQGLNNIAIESISSVGVNLDAFGFASDKATFTDAGTVPGIVHADNNGLPYIKVKPTETTTGIWTDGCSNCGLHSSGDHVLPVITDSAYTLNDGVYSISVEGGHVLTFGTKVHRFECENMNLLDANGVAFDKSKKTISNDGASDGRCLYKMNNIGNKIILTINSSKAEKVDMTVCVAARVNDKGKCFTVTFAQMYKVAVNGTEVPTTVSVEPNEPLTYTNDYFEFHAINIGSVNLVAGENTIVLTVSDKDGSAVAGNLDYVELTTSVADLIEIAPTAQE